MNRRPFVLLDRDGTIIVERHYLAEPGQIEFLSGAIEGLRHLLQMGLGLVVLTNQSGVGRGFFDEAQLDLIHRRFRELLNSEGIPLEGIYSCPHTPENNCSCRKPKPGLAQRAAQELGFDLRASFVIGDKPVDIELGQNLGATTFLVRTGYGAGFVNDSTVNPDYVADDLFAAAQIIQSLLAKTERTIEP
ncbi:MAG TPA: HAD family hydrolase [Candidatus Binatia bacterium]|jgi:histidinol-phosphate phosphatase family protein